MTRLSIRIYLGFLLVVVVFFVSTGVWFRFVETRERLRVSDQAEAIAALLVPEQGATKEELDAALQRLANAAGTGVALFSADGARLAEAGDFAPLPDLDREESHWLGPRGPDSAGVLRLPDGRWLTARVKPPGGPRHGLAVLALFALALAAGAYPVARGIAGRLERVSKSVDAWGGGDLAVRAPVEGRDEVAQLAQRFNQAAERVEALVASQRTLLASASHELRSPLARLRMAAEILSEGEGATPERTAALRAQLERDVAALDAGVEELLLVSRLDLVDAESAWQEVDLLGLAAEVAAEADEDVVVSGEGGEVCGDERSLRHLVRNLLSNARRHAPGSPVEVEVGGASSARRWLEVRDRGPGIPEGERERVFDAFSRGEGSRDGLGLGLAIVQQIAVRHGGRAEATAREGGGTTLRVELPREPGAAREG